MPKKKRTNRRRVAKFPYFGSDLKGKITFLIYSWFPHFRANKIEGLPSTCQDPSRHFFKTYVAICLPFCNHKEFGSQSKLLCITGAVLIPIQALNIAQQRGVRANEVSASSSSKEIT